MHLGEVSVTNRCSYEASFIVPDVPSGPYAIVPIEHARRGAAALTTLSFRVTC